jgi:cytochrome c5
MSVTTGWLMTLAALAVAGALGATADAQGSRSIAAQDERTGEQIVNASCGTCHDARPIQMSAKNEAEWSATIETMIQMGAVVEPADRPALLAYLVRFHGPMPEGRGKDVVLNICTMCHDLTRVKVSRHTPDEWEDILVSMLNEGAPLSDADFPVVLNYLARNFGLE